MTNVEVDRNKQNLAVEAGSGEVVTAHLLCHRLQRERLHGTLRAEDGTHHVEVAERLVEAAQRTASVTAATVTVSVTAVTVTDSDSGNTDGQPTEKYRHSQ